MYKFRKSLKKEKRIFLLFLSFIVFSFLFSSIFVYAQSLDYDGDGWNDEIESSYGTSIDNPQSYPLDTDDDGTQDNDSVDGKFLGDLDDDNDGLLDIYENYLGANSKDSSNVLKVPISGVNYFLVDVNGDSFYDNICNPINGFYNNVKVENSVVFIDLDKDTKWDYTYTNGVVSKYSNLFENLWIYIIVAVVIIVLIIFILFKKGIIYLYQEEYLVEE